MWLTVRGRYSCRHTIRATSSSFELFQEFYEIGSISLDTASIVRSRVFLSVELCQVEFLESEREMKVTNPVNIDAIKAVLLHCGYSRVDESAPRECMGHHVGEHLSTSIPATY